ncbi:MAG TPA: hypothetical protein VGE01_08800 [Fimbriimonas sp.]
MAVRIEEYAFATPEQRRAVAASIEDEESKGARVVGMVPVALSEGEEGDLLVLRMAVFYEGGPLDAGDTVAAAAAAVPEPEAEAIVEQIMSLPTEESRDASGSGEDSP